MMQQSYPARSRGMFGAFLGASFLIGMYLLLIIVEIFSEALKGSHKIAVAILGISMLFALAVTVRQAVKNQKYVQRWKQFYTPPPLLPELLLVGGLFAGVIAGALILFGIGQLFSHGLYLQTALSLLAILVGLAIWQFWGWISWAFGEVLYYLGVAWGWAWPGIRTAWKWFVRQLRHFSLRDFFVALLIAMAIFAEAELIRAFARGLLSTDGYLPLILFGGTMSFSVLLLLWARGIINARSGAWNWVSLIMGSFSGAVFGLLFGGVIVALVQRGTTYLVIVGMGALLLLAFSVAFIWAIGHFPTWLWKLLGVLALLVGIVVGSWFLIQRGMLGGAIVAIFFAILMIFGLTLLGLLIATIVRVVRYSGLRIVWRTFFRAFLIWVSIGAIFLLGFTIVVILRMHLHPAGTAIWLAFGVIAIFLFMIVSAALTIHAGSPFGWGYAFLFLAAVLGLILGAAMVAGVLWLAATGKILPLGISLGILVLGLVIWLIVRLIVWLVRQSRLPAAAGSHANWYWGEFIVWFLTLLALGLREWTGVVTLLLGSLVIWLLFLIPMRKWGGLVVVSILRVVILTAFIWSITLPVNINTVFGYYLVLILLLFAYVVTLIVVVVRRFHKQPLVLVLLILFVLACCGFLLFWIGILFLALLHAAFSILPPV